MSPCVLMSGSLHSYLFWWRTPFYFSESGDILWPTDVVYDLKNIMFPWISYGPEASNRLCFHHITDFPLTKTLKPGHKTLLPVAFLNREILQAHVSETVRNIHGLGARGEIIFITDLFPFTFKKKTPKNKDKKTKTDYFFQHFPCKTKSF